MCTFEVSKLNKNQWDDIVVKSDGDYRQFYEWGELKKIFGWDVLRLELKKNFEITSTCQLLIKRKWPLSFIYFPGSINGDQIYIKQLINFIKNYKTKYFLKYLRIDLTIKKNEKVHNLIKNNNLFESLYKRSGNTKIECDLKYSITEILKNCDRKWRYNYNRALKNPMNIKIILNPNTDLIYKLSKDLEKEKKLGRGHSHEEVKNIFTNLKKQIIYLEATDNTGRILGFRASLYNKNQAWDFFAVSTKLGRAYKSGYPLMIKTLEEAQKRDVKKYHFIGENPDRRKNVFNFKKGLNGKIHEYVGEIEWTNFYPVRLLVNLIFLLLYSNILPKKFKKH